MKDRKTSYSKILPIVTGLLFAATLYFGFMFAKATTSTTVTDATFLVSAITITGGIFGTTCLWYMKKAQSENIVKLKSAIYKDISDTKVQYLEKVLQLKQKYKDTENTIDTSLEDDLDDLTNSAETDLAGSADEALSEATATIEQQSY